VTNAAIRYTAIDTNSDDGGVPTLIPFNETLNPAGSFTIEAWLRPTEEGNGNAQSPLFNRDPYDASPNRSGFDFFQRDSATGWNFRMFNGDAHNKVFNITGGAYVIGEWCHLVAVYDSATPSAALYLNGVQVAFSDAPDGVYQPNTSAPFSIGGYSDGAQNPFVGDIDEVAIYTNALTDGVILAHYQNGTNASRTIAYDALVLKDNAVEYLRLDEPARAVAANSGTLGSALDATYVNATNTLTGPATPAFAGFETNNLAVNFDGATSYIELGNPVALNFTNAFTLEAWVQPAASQSTDAYIIAHGGNNDLSGEVYLGIVEGMYQIRSTSADASYPVPDEDLGKGNWVYLVGTWDGTNWSLFRNGALVSSMADTTNPTQVNNANWAIGARGKWKYAAGFPASGEQNVFAGGIDEAAIYKYALSTNQIATHYYSGLYGAQPLSYVLANDSLSLTWSAGTLQQADTINGHFADVTGATSPYVLSIEKTQKKFFRIRY
jgi:hypothetical protein